MFESIITALIGVVCIILGAINMSGNISTLHSYHRKRVSDKDRIPFGKTVGFGTILCGVGIVLMGVFSAVNFYTKNQLHLTVGIVCMCVGVVVGIAISFYGMIKYNKGIF
jgi:hypothetical protein